jgi:hypothetical protein
MIAGTSGCPAGWRPAIGTVFDSWPQLGTRECADYSGCKWAGCFSQISAGWSASTCRRGSTWRDYGPGTDFLCRWTEATVAKWSMAATWDRDPTIQRKQVEVMVEGRPGATVTVNVGDVCKDSDCAGCCSKNTGNGAWTMIDMEKVPASRLLGFSYGAPGFDINSVATPAHNGLRPGAGAGAMPLCFRVVREQMPDLPALV